MTYKTIRIFVHDFDYKSCVVSAVVRRLINTGRGEGIEASHVS